MKFEKLVVMGLFLLCSRTLWAMTGTAELKGTAAGSAIKGTVQLADTKDGLHVQAQITGLTPGAHGFHIHEFGSCADMGKAAGSHYNPRGTPHGHIMKDGPMKAHSGDMGNIQADTQGTATLDMVIPGVTLSTSPVSVAGRAMVVHEKADDFGQPVGNAGGRVACGPIIITGN